VKREKAKKDTGLKGKGIRSRTHQKLTTTTTTHILERKKHSVEEKSEGRDIFGVRIKNSI